MEFVALLATLLQKHVAQPVPPWGETLVQVRKRVVGVVRDSNVELLLQMRDPGSVRVRWVERALPPFPQPPRRLGPSELALSAFACWTDFNQMHKCKPKIRT